VVGPRLLVQCQTRQGTNFLWAIKLKKKLDKQENSWTTSALKERTLGRASWIRHRSNRQLSEYEPLVSDTIQDPADWPKCPFYEILEAALQGRHITSLDHPVLVDLLKGK
jgi:hypothetical protein